MKKILIAISAAAMLCSCGTASQKQQQATQAAAEQAKQETIDSVAVAQQQQKTIDSLKVVVTKDSIAKEEKAATETRPAEQAVASSSTGQTQTVQKKKGWSNTAKGAAIGTGVGAVTGAIVSKHKGAGAVVGGLIGAGVGTGTGAIIDSKKKKDKQ